LLHLEGKSVGLMQEIDTANDNNDFHREVKLNAELDEILKEIIFFSKMFALEFDDKGYLILL